jgi:hypothetical protein
MAPKKKCSQRQQGTLFKPGSDQRRWQRLPKEDLPEEDPPEEAAFSPTQMTAGKNYTRLPRDICNAVRVDNDVRTVTVLRPTEPSTSLLEEESSRPNLTVQGNRVVSMERLCTAITSICKQHQQQFPGCTGCDFKMPSEGERRLGLGVTVTIACKHCEFTHRVQLYDEVEQPSRPGANPPKLNAQLAAVLTKSAISLGDTRLLLAALDIPPVTERSLSKHINQMSPLWADFNKEDMHNNCEVLKAVHRHREDSSMDITCMSDTVFNNPPKGRAMSQPGTMCSTPLLEAETDLHMVLALSTHSKLCTKGVRCNGRHDGGQCSANYPVHRPMGNAEKTAMASNILQVEETGLKVSGLVTDGIAKEYNIAGFNPEKLHCIVHHARSQRRRVQGMALSEQMTGSKNKTTVSRYKTVLARAISNRCTMELSAARKRHGTGPGFLVATEAARCNVVKCFTGGHAQCHLSGVCKVKPSDDTVIPAYLPNKSYLVNMSAEDEQKLQAAIDFRLNATAARQQRHLATTNPVEAIHLRTLKVCPKSRTYRRNYHYRNHSAMNSQTRGHCGSLHAFCTQAKCAQVNTTHLLAMQMKEKYWHLRRQSATYKERRRQLAREKFILKRFSCLNVENGADDNTTLLDHDY